MKTKTTHPTALHEFYLQFLIDSGIDKQKSTGIEDLVYDDIDDDDNEILMRWINWIFANRDGAIKIAKLITNGKMCGLKLKDGYENEFSMIQHTVTPFVNLTNDEIADMCIDMQMHDLTQDTAVSFWEVDYKYASRKEV